MDPRHQKTVLLALFVVIFLTTTILITDQVYSSYSYRDESILPMERMIDGAIILPEYLAPHAVFNDTQFPLSELLEITGAEAISPEDLNFTATHPAAPERTLSWKDHTIAAGETLAGLAKKNKIKLQTLMNANNIGNAKKIKLGQKIRIPSLDVAVHKISKGESIWEISRLYGSSAEYILKVNKLSDPASIRYGQKLIIPEPKKIPAVTRAAKNGTFFIWPCAGRLTSKYGMRRHPILRRYIFHRGIDLGSGWGSRIKAASDGKVKYVGYLGGYGKAIIIEHSNGYTTLYGHLSGISVAAGQKVKQGQNIGKSGNSGRSTGPHLHFEIRRYNRVTDPLPILARK